MGVQVRSSSRTSTPTRNPRPTPTHPHSTQKSRFSCPQAGCACGQAEYRWARGTWARWEVDVVACARCVRPQCVAWPVRSSRPQVSSNVGCEHKKAPGRSARGFPSAGADDGNRTRVTSSCTWGVWCCLGPFVRALTHLVEVGRVCPRSISWV